MGSKIKEYRERLGLSQTQLSLKIGLAQSNLSILENGRRVPWPKVRRDLARVLGVTESELVPSGRKNGTAES